MTERRMLLGQMCRVTASDLFSLVATNGLAKIVQNLRGSLVVVCSSRIDKLLCFAKPLFRVLDHFLHSFLAFAIGLG